MYLNSVNQPAKYRIALEGELDEQRAEWFEGMDIEVRKMRTTLEGILPDQSALFGLLARIRDLGIPLLSVERIEPITE
jgi:hypothetical protein